MTEPEPWPALPGQPTRYRNRDMRSKLERSYAEALDTAGLAWSYEPRPFTGPAGHYLPDYRVDLPGEPPHYIELKPNVVLHERPHALHELGRLATIWSEEPAARLVLRGWHQNQGRATSQITGLAHPGEHAPSWWLLRDPVGAAMRGEDAILAYHGDGAAARACPRCSPETLQFIPAPDQRPEAPLEAVIDRLTRKFTRG